MSQLKTLLLRRQQLQAEGRANLEAAAKEERALTAEEKTSAEAIEAKITAIDELVAFERNLLEEERATAMEIPSGASLQVGHNRANDAPWGPQVGSSAPEPEREWARNVGFGEFLKAVRKAKIESVVDQRLHFEAAAQGAGIADGSDGGFLVRPEFTNDISLRATAGEILQRVRRLPMSGNTVTVNMIDETSRATGSRFGTVQAYWVDEGTAITASRPKLNRVRLELHKIAALGYATDELMADTGGLFGAIMTQAFGEELRFLVEDAIPNGTGAGQPLGIVGHAGTVSVAKEAGQVAATIVKANIDKMWARMYAPARAGAIWLINQDVETQLDNMTMAVGTGGVPVYLPPGGLSETPYSRLKGRPVIPVEYCPTLGTVGDIILVNLDEYLFVEPPAGMQGASSMHVAFTTDEQAFRMTWRVDGQPRWRTVLTPFKGTLTQSPYVTLDTRA